MPLNKETLTHKIRTLNNSQQAIEGLSGYCLFYRKEARDVVALWEREFMTAGVGLKQSMLYVANHLMQESRKRGREFIDEFFKVLPKALRAGYKTNDEKIKKCMGRLIDVWDERKVFGSSHIKTFRDIASGDKVSGSMPRRESLDPAKHHALRPVAEALQYVETASGKASEAMNRSLGGIREGLVDNGTAEELRAGVELLGQYSSSLEAEIAGRKHVVGLLKQLIVQQEDSMARNEENLRMCSLQREKIDRRLALLAGSGALGVMHSAMSAPGSMALPHMGMPRPPMGPPPPGPYPGAMGGYMGGGGGGGMGFDDGGMGYSTGLVHPPSPSAAPLGAPPPMAHAPTPSIPKPQPPPSPPAAPNGAGHHSPSAPAPDSPMPPPMSPQDAATPPFTGGDPSYAPSFPEPAPPEASAAAPAGDTTMVDLNPEALADLASKLVNASDPSVLLSVLSNLDPDEQTQLQSQVMGSTGGDTGVGAEEEYDPDNPY